MTKQKHTKRLGALLSGTLLFSMLLLPTQAGQMHILVDGSSYDGPVLMQNSTTYIPMRHFLTELGWTVQWLSLIHICCRKRFRPQPRFSIPASCAI